MEAATGIKPFVGVLNIPGQLDKGDKQIIDELTDAINLPKGQKVSAIIDTDKIVGWTIVEVHEDGSIKPISDKKFNNLKGLISEYK